MHRGLLLIPFKLIIHMTMFRKLNFWPLPKATGGGDPKTVPVLVPFMWVTNTPNLFEFRKKFFWPPPPPPPGYPQVPRLGMTQAAEWKSRLICYISFICEKNHKVLFKNLWKWLCNSGLMIFDLLAPPQGPRGRGPQKWCWCMGHSCE